MTDFEQWVNQVQSWNKATSNIPLMVRQDIMKSKLKLEDPKHGLTSVFEDPLAIQYAMGYKDRRYALSYDVCKRIPQQLSIISAILQTRCNQVASFAVPFRNSKSVGFVIKHKNPRKNTTKGEMEMMQSLESFIYKCGSKDPNPHNDRPRDDFETFLKKVVRDSLMFDQLTFEVVPDRRGMPYEFMAVDASTIRLACPKDSPFGTEYMGDGGSLAVNIKPSHNNSLLYSGIPTTDPYRLFQLMRAKGDKKPEFVQVINGQIYDAYTRDELCFGVRNPRTDIYIQGYGYSELEQLITTITAHLYAEEYNRRFFMQGSAPKGILNFKGDNMDPQQLEVFRRQWRAQMEGVENFFRTPIFQSEQGVEWIPLDRSNSEMEYSQWMEYLIKITSAVFLIDPAELNFDLHGGVSQTPLFESSQEWKLKASRDRGLKPLLRFIAKQINEHVIEKIDDHFYLDFAGLDELTEMEKWELAKERVTTITTLNEERREQNFPPLPHGDVPMNPTYVQVMQIRDAAEQAQGGGAPGAPPEQGGGQGGQPGMGGDQGAEGGKEDVPQYADTFTKGLKARSGEKFLEISLDDFIGATR